VTETVTGRQHRHQKVCRVTELEDADESLVVPSPVIPDDTGACKVILWRGGDWILLVADCSMLFPWMMHRRG
jgi:hypothetical protein